MAQNSILKLNVDTSEYDAKLKDAAKGIRHLADVAHEGAGDLTGLEKSTLDYVKAVGEMETKSRTASGQVRELESTYKELKVIYDQLNEVEKADEGGKALAASLDKLKQRAQDARKSLDDASKSLQQNENSSKEDSSALEQLASKFVVNVDALKLFNVGLKAAKVALDVAKDAFMSSEANVDEWGRTVAASESLYKGFLNSLNTGDISGYLDNINAIVQAARDAYNELDRLGTMKTIQSPKMSAQQTENARMRMMLQTGRYIAPVDGRRATMEDGQKLTKEQLQVIERQLQNGMKTVTNLVGNEVKQTGKAIDAIYNRQAKELGMGIKEFRKGTSSMEEFDKRMEGYQKYQEWNKQAQIEFAKQGGRGSVNFDKNNPFSEFKKWGTFRVDGKDYNDLVQLIQQRDQQSAQAYQTQGQMYRTMNRVDGRINGGGGKGGGKKDTIDYADDSIMAQEKLVADLTKKWKTAGDELRDGYLEQLNAAKEKLDEMTGKTKGPDFDKLFPDNSAQNYNTGYAGSAQSRYTSAIADFAQSPLNTSTVSSLVSDLQSALSEADFGTPIYNSISEKLKDATTMSTLIQELMERGVEGADLESVAEQMKAALLDGDIPDEKVKDFIAKLNEQIKEQGGIELDYNANTGEVSDKKQGKAEDAMKKFSAEAGKFVGGLGEVANGLRAAGISIPNEVNELLSGINGFMQIISGFQSLISMVSTPAQIANTTAIANLTAILTAKMFMPGMNNGGIVPHAANGYFVSGTHMSGDVTPIMANEGELVLNKAQQFSLAAQLTSGYGAMGAPEVRFSGEDLFVVMSNYLQRAGYGEILTSKG